MARSPNPAARRGAGIARETTGGQNPDRKVGRRVGPEDPWTPTRGAEEVFREGSTGEYPAVKRLELQDSSRVRVGDTVRGNPDFGAFLPQGRKVERRRRAESGKSARGASGAYPGRTGNGRSGDRSRDGRGELAREVTRDPISLSHPRQTSRDREGAAPTSSPAKRRGFLCRYVRRCACSRKRDATSSPRQVRDVC